MALGCGRLRHYDTAPARHRGDDEKASELGLYSVFGIAVDSANETVWVTNSTRGTAASASMRQILIINNIPA